MIKSCFSPDFALRMWFYTQICCFIDYQQVVRGLWLSTLLVNNYYLGGSVGSTLVVGQKTDDPKAEALTSSIKDFQEDFKTDSTADPTVALLATSNIILLALNLLLLIVLCKRSRKRYTQHSLLMSPTAPQMAENPDFSCWKHYH